MKHAHLCAIFAQDVTSEEVESEEEDEE